MQNIARDAAALHLTDHRKETAMIDEIYVQASRRYGTLSPLRYPGGKASLAGYFGDIISALALDSPRYVEPYAGGVGAGIALLREGIVDHLVINDIDPAVHAFWNSVIEFNDQFVERVTDVTLTVEEWQKQREIYKAKDDTDALSLGFAFFYLNRTNRSGILNAGVIGGLAQAGNYKIDARFNRETLVGRLRAIGDLADQITVTDLDGRTVIRQYADDPSAFMYIDPPYVQAGSQLYLNAFDHGDHAALAEVVNDASNSNWIMTYDMSPLIERLYAEQFQCRLNLTYSVKNYVKAEELLVASPTVAATLRNLERFGPVAAIASG